MEEKNIIFKKKPDREEEIKKILHPKIKEWFFKKYKSFSEPQLYAVKEIHEKNNILITAPTGSGKTLTGFLSIINELFYLEEQNLLEEKVYAVYVSPLKALNEDIKVNLIEPLKEIEKIIGKKTKIRIAVRTGDTSSSEKQKMLKKPPHILITTPESLGIILSTKKFIEKLKGTQYIIIDEIHSLAENKRGTHLSLTLEKLQYYNPNITRIGLSATVAPIEEIAKYLSGYEYKINIKTKKEEYTLRKIKIVDVQYLKKMDLKVISPAEDLINTDIKKVHTNMYKIIHELIQQHKTTLIFTNTRSATERVVNYLKEKYPQSYTGKKGTLIGAHHSSLSKTLRHKIEEQLRRGELKVVVSSTSLELGIDIGYVDLVILLGSPKSVARAIQRIGRAGHKLHETSKGRIIVMDRDDLIECSLILKAAKEKKIDKIHIPKNSLDVLSQQIFGFTLNQEWEEKTLYNIIRQSYNYHNLEYEDYKKILLFLSGKYKSLEEKNVYPKIFYEEKENYNIIRARGKTARIIYMTNIGTIPDESYVKVKLQGTKEIIGKIDESFLERLKKNDVFVLGGEKYIFIRAQGNTAFVKGSVDIPPTIPNWVSEMLPLSFDLAIEIGKFRERIKELFKLKEEEKKIKEYIKEYLYLEDKKTISAIYNYMKEQYYFYDIPTYKHIIVERYEQDGYKYLLFNTLYGRRVNDVLSRAIAYIGGKIHKTDVQVGITDNGFYIITNKEFNLKKILQYLKAEKLRILMEEAIEKTEVLNRRFRHCAARSLMILRNYKGRTKTAGRQQLNSIRILKTIREIDKNFIILKEAKREVLEDMMDIENAKKIVLGIEEKKIKVEEINIGIPSPFSFNLVIQGRSDLIKIEEKQEFLKRMHNLVLAKIELNKKK